MGVDSNRLRDLTLVEGGWIEGRVVDLDGALFTAEMMMAARQPLPSPLAGEEPVLDRVIVSTSRGVLAAGPDVDALRGSATTLNAELVGSLKTDG